MLVRRARIGVILAILLSVSAAAQTERPTPLAFWRDAIKSPLSGPDGEQHFIRLYKRAALTAVNVPYLEGSVVSVAKSTSGSTRVLLSMESDGTADAAILFDGRHWRLRSEPQKGTVVRFLGVMTDFTKQPFMLTFEPNQVDGLDVDTAEPNPRVVAPRKVK
jgi:hypothetical protein